MIYTFENLYILIGVLFCWFIINIIGFVTKKAFFPMICVLSSVASLIIHSIIFEELGESFGYNIIIDLIALAVSITNLLIVDEIETRRSVIKKVFGHKYKKK